MINKEGLRYEDEFVRHKVLDLIGDLRLLGLPIVGHVEAQEVGARSEHPAGSSAGPDALRLGTGRGPFSARRPLFLLSSA